MPQLLTSEPDPKDSAQGGDRQCVQENRVAVPHQNAPKAPGKGSYDPLDDVPWSVRQRLAMVKNNTAREASEQPGDRGKQKLAASAGRRERKSVRKPPHHRVCKGFDVRSRGNRGRSRERKAREHKRSEPTRNVATRRSAHVLTWNVGGVPMDRLEETVMLMPALGLGQVEVVAFQEISCPAGITALTCGQGENRWHLVAGKRKTNGEEG